MHVARSGNDVVKKASELDIEEKHSGAGAEADNNGEDNTVEAGSKAGEKHARDDDAEENGEHEAEDEDAKEDEAPAKKQKTAAAKKETATPAKKKGRPAKKAAPAKKAKADAAMDVDVKDATEEAPKKKGPGRPKKGETKAGGAAAEKKKKTKAVANGEGIGSRTRSKKSS